MTVKLAKNLLRERVRASRGLRAADEVRRCGQLFFTRMVTLTEKFGVECAANVWGRTAGNAVGALRRASSGVSPRQQTATTAAASARSPHEPSRLPAAVCCFKSVRGEPDTDLFIEWAIVQGITVWLPATLPGGTLEWRACNGGAFQGGAYGIPEPVGVGLSSGRLARHPELAPQLVFVPAASASVSGERLGWGMGFYDRALAEFRAVSPRTSGGSGDVRFGRCYRAPVYAVVYEKELVESLPTQRHDVPLDGVVTQYRTVHCSTSL